MQINGLEANVETQIAARHRHIDEEKDKETYNMSCCWMGNSISRLGRHESCKNITHKCHAIQVYPSVF